MPLRNHFCKKSVPSGQYPPTNSLHVRPCVRSMLPTKTKATIRRQEQNAGAPRSVRFVCWMILVVQTVKTFPGTSRHMHALLSFLIFWVLAYGCFFLIQNPNTFIHELRILTSTAHAKSNGNH